MPWQETSAMSLRREFCALAHQPDQELASLCRRFGISRKTGYKWLARSAAHEPLSDRSRRPHRSPTRTASVIETTVVAVRTAHPAWGGRKIMHVLRRRGIDPVPAPSTVSNILRRHGLLERSEAHPGPFTRFEHPEPNDLWQLDFMGHHAMTTGRVHPLTLVDDHSRYALGLFACAWERHVTVVAHLTSCFQRFGLPRVVLTDNGPPWGTSGNGGISTLEAWLLRLGIRVAHGRTYHPQTQGKVERLHGTIAAEVTRFQTFPDLVAAQVAFDRFRTCYNHERPHEALGYAVPASRYQVSPRELPTTLPEIVYGPEDAVRKVRGQGAIFFANRSIFVGTGLIGLPVAVRPTTTDGCFHVYFCAKQVATIDLHKPSNV